MNLNEFMQIPFEEGIKNFRDRYPILASSTDELMKRYSQEYVFGIVKSTSMIMTKSIQYNLAVALHFEKTTEEILEEIQKQLKLKARAYAETVFRTNLNTAYNAGRQKQAIEFPEFIVGFEFHATHDRDTRHNHFNFDAMRAPANHPAWEVATPPLGFNCRCVIRQITRPEAKEKKWLDGEGNLIPFHPGIGSYFSVPALKSVGAYPDNQFFGRKAK